MKTYSVIYADPPWRYEFSPTSSRAIEKHYPTMSMDELCALEIPAAENCVLYLWATSPKLVEALDLIRAWGFRYRTHAVWDKELIGIGCWFRGQHELLMVATKGEISPPQPEFRISSVIRCKRGLHSRKPDYVRDMIQKWFPDAPKLEMFSRIKRPDWDSFGNEVEHDLLSAA
jgi:N6-adenosine-specific RNA methylase IME4